MRTTNKEFKVQVQEHITNGALSEEHGETIQEQLQAVVSEFTSWYSPYEQKRTPNKYEAFKEFMLGLPSCFNIEYYYDQISNTLRTWFEACGETYEEKPKDEEAKLYYHLVTREFERLCKLNGVAF